MFSCVERLLSPVGTLADSVCTKVTGGRVEPAVCGSRAEKGVCGVSVRLAAHRHGGGKSRYDYGTGEGGETS